MEHTSQPAFTPTGAVKMGFLLLQKHFMPFLALLAVTVLFTIIGNLIGAGIEFAAAEGQGLWAVAVLWQIIYTAIGIWLAIANVRLMLRLVDDKMIDWKAVFAVDGWLLLHMFIAGVLLAIAVLFGFLLLIVPGIILALGFMFYSYVMVEERATAWSSLRASWRLTKGNRWRLFLFQLLVLVLIVVPFLVAAALFGGSTLGDAQAFGTVLKIAGALVAIVSIIWVLAVAFANAFAQAWIYRQLKPRGGDLGIVNIRS